MKKIIIFLFCLITTSLFPQKLDWGIYAVNTGLEWNFSAMGKNNSTVLCGHIDQLSNRSGEETFYDANGNKAIEYLSGRHDIIVCISENGLLSWYKELNGEFSKVLGMTCDKNGNTILLVYVEPEFTEKEMREEMPIDYEMDEDSLSEIINNADDEESIYGRLPEYAEDEFILGGFYIVKINLMGEFISLSKTDLELEAEIEISECSIHPSGNYIFCGWAKPGKLSSSQNVIMGKAGGDFILMMDSTGKTKWLDAISYNGNSCCSHSSNYPRMAISKNGNVFLGGTFEKGAEFGGEIIKIADANYSSSSYSGGEDSYIASYSANGKLNWVTTAKGRTRLQSIAVSDNQIAISLTSYGLSKAFGMVLDTADKKYNSLLILDHNGETKRTIGIRGQSHDLFYDSENSLHAMGEIHRASKDIKFHGKFLPGARDDFFIAVFDNKLAIKEFFSTSYLMSSNTEYRIKIGSDKNYYLFGEMWGTLPIEASLLDKAFKGGKIYGGAPFLCRIKRSILEK